MVRICLNGKPVTGHGTEDEPPASFHVLRQIIGLQITAVEIDPQHGGRILVRFGKRALMVGIDIERGADGVTVDLGVDVFTRNAPEKFL